MVWVVRLAQIVVWWYEVGFACVARGSILCFGSLRVRSGHPMGVGVRRESRGFLLE